MLKLKPWAGLRCARCAHYNDSHQHYRPGTECSEVDCLCGEFTWVPVIDIPIYALTFLKTAWVIRRETRKLDRVERAAAALDESVL